MASVGGAAAQGLESGIGLGLRLRNQQQDEEQRARNNRIQDQQLEQQQQDRTRKLAREDEDAALKALDSELEGLRATGEGYAAKYGKAVPDEIGKPYAERVATVSGARNTLLRKRYEPIVQAREQAIKDLVSRLQTGQVDIKDVPDEDLYKAVVTATRRDPRDLMSVDGQPSKVHTSVTDIMTGLETNNEGMLLRGANVLLEPELKVGVGEQSPHGGRIVGKKIVKMIPDPNAPGKFMLVVKVYVSKDKAGTAGDVARADHVAEEGAPPGATGYYLAPLTENRSSAPNDTVKSIDLTKAMDYAGQMQTFATLLDHPDVRQKVERGMAASKETPDNFLEAFYAVKGKMPGKDIDWKTLNPNQTLVGLDPRTGREVTRIEGAPKITPATGLAGQIEAVRRYAEENGVTEDEAAQQLQERGLLRAPKAAKGGKGGGGGGGGAAGLSGKGEGLTGEEFLATLSPDDARLVRGISEGKFKASDIPTKGGRREQVLSWVQQFQPEGGSAGKALPEPVRKVIVEARDNAATMDRMLSSFKPQFAGKGVLGIGADLQLDASARLGADNDSVQWWKNYRKQAQLVERHAMFGASLTTGEQAAWASADISPGMDPKVIEENLKTRAELTRKVLDYTRQDMIDAGHSEKRVGAIAGRAGLAEQPTDTPQRKSGKPTQDAAPRLPADKAAARKAYDALPSGATFIDPNGVTRRKP